jgi:hypothetical protein
MNQEKPTANWDQGKYWVTPGGRTGKQSRKVCSEAVNLFTGRSYDVRAEIDRVLQGVALGLPAGLTSTTYLHTGTTIRDGNWKQLTTMSPVNLFTGSN